MGNLPALGLELPVMVMDMYIQALVAVFYVNHKLLYVFSKNKQWDTALQWLSLHNACSSENSVVWWIWQPLLCTLNVYVPHTCIDNLYITHKKMRACFSNQVNFWYCSSLLSDDSKVVEFFHIPSLIIACSMQSLEVKCRVRFTAALKMACSRTYSTRTQT